MKRIKTAVIFGTRPEAIKLCPLIKTFEEDAFFQCLVCVTGQHREMLHQVLDVFGVTPNTDFALMQPNQSLASLTCRLISALDEWLVAEKPDVVVVQGDTTTVLASALTAFYHHIPIAHVEAGLRTWNLESPWPEEANRALVSRLAKWHFCPTESNKSNLMKEGIDPEGIHVVGNTVIDALLMAVSKLKLKSMANGGTKRQVLITGHRRENFGIGLENICRAIRILATEFQDVTFVYPVHLNPNVQEPVRRILAIDSLPNVHLVGPQDYLPFVKLMVESDIILTDSGGVQEEAPSLGKPVLVMRDTTERPEAVDAGTVRIVGTATDSIVSNVRELLTDEVAYRRMAGAINPYGDGQSCVRIARILKETCQ